MTSTSHQGATIVVVEDDQSVREMLSAVLRYEGYDVQSYPDGEQALDDHATVDAAVVILDVGLPGIDGKEVCRLLREKGRTGAILMLTAMHQVADRVEGLDAGADDYLVKPFALDELFARVRSMVRRADGATGSTSEEQRPADVVAVGDVHMNVATREVHVCAEPINLTKIEFDLLQLLLLNSPSVLSREVIHERIWGYDQEHGSNTLEVFISQLRRKLATAAKPDTVIQTVRGVGYVARVNT